MFKVNNKRAFIINFEQVIAAGYFAWITGQKTMDNITNFQGTSISWRQAQINKNSHKAGVL